MSNPFVNPDNETALAIAATVIAPVAKEEIKVTPVTVRKIHRKVMEADKELQTWQRAQLQTELVYTTSS